MALKVQAPTRDIQTEHMLAAKEFSFDFMTGIPLDSFDEERSLNNQARVGNPVHAATVERYVTGLGNGDVFPAIIVADLPRHPGFLIVDGNHRFQAAKAKKRKTIDAYVIRGASPNAITQLTFEVNTRHGLPSSEADRIHQALYLMDGGVTAEEAARRLGLKVASLRTAANMAEANRRSLDVRLPQESWSRLNQGVKLRLNQISMDDVFGLMAKVAIDARLSTNEVSAAVSEIAKLRTASKQSEFVKGLRATYAERVQATGSEPSSLAGRQLRTPRMILGLALGQMGSLPRPEMVVERMTPEDKLHYLHKVDGAITRLSEIRDALKK